MWAVTLTFEIAALGESEIAALEQALTAWDAAAANIPGRGVDVTLYPAESISDPLIAATQARAALTSFIDADPVSIHVETEESREQRANSPTLPTLVSPPEIAEILGVSRQRVHQLRANEGFPAPLFELRTGAIWDARAIERFARDWDRRAGRPPRPPASAPPADVEAAVPTAR